MQHKAHASPLESLTEDALAQVTGGAHRAEEQIQRNDQGQLVGPVLQKKEPNRGDTSTLIFF